MAFSSFIIRWHGGILVKFRNRVRSHDPTISVVPSGFKRYGHIMVLRSSEPLSPELGQAVLELYPWCTVVYQHLDTVGQSRVPQLVRLAGEDQPQVVHRENGVSYQLDVSRITFSGGNRHLRERLVGLVNDGEFLVDMFAAVGNLSMQPLVHCDISALLIEQDPYTFRYLQATLELNHLDTGIAVHSDCRTTEISDVADRIFMGYHEVDRTHLEAAVRIAKDQATLHLHPIVQVEDQDAPLRTYVDLLTQLGVKVTASERHRVKQYAPALEHHELILDVKKV